MTFKYMKKSEIKSLCNSNSMCRDTFNAFKKEFPHLVERIVDLYSCGFNYPRGHIKYEMNYKIYDYEYWD